MNGIAVIDTTALRALVAEEVQTQLAPIEGMLREALERAAPPHGNQLLTREEVAAFLRVDVRTLRRLVLANELPGPIRIGERIVRWRRKDIERAMN